MKRILILLAFAAAALGVSAQVSVTDFGDRLTFYEASVQKYTIPKSQIKYITLNADSTTMKVERLGVFGGSDYAFSTSNVDTASFVADSSFSFSYPNLTTPGEIRLWLLVSAGILQK